MIVHVRQYLDNTSTMLLLLLILVDIHASILHRVFAPRQYTPWYTNRVGDALLANFEDPIK